MIFLVIGIALGVTMGSFITSAFTNLSVTGSVFVQDPPPMPNPTLTTVRMTNLGNCMISSDALSASCPLANMTIGTTYQIASYIFNPNTISITVNGTFSASNSTVVSVSGVPSLTIGPNSTGTIVTSFTAEEPGTSTLSLSFNP